VIFIKSGNSINTDIGHTSKPSVQHYVHSCFSLTESHSDPSHIHIMATNAYHSIRVHSPQIQHTRQLLAPSPADGDSIRLPLPPPLLPLPTTLLLPLPLFLPTPLPLHPNLPHHRLLHFHFHLSLPLPRHNSTLCMISALTVHKISTCQSDIKTIYARFFGVPFCQARALIVFRCYVVVTVVGGG